MPTILLDVLGLFLVSVGAGVLAYGLIVVVNINPGGYLNVARGGGLAAAGLALLLVSWLRDRRTFTGTHRSRP